MGRMGVLITWHELTGIRPTDTMLRERLAPFGLRPILLGLARLSAQLTTWHERQNQPVELEIVRRTLPRFYPAVQHLVSTTRDRVILTRVTLLYVAKQALAACRLDGREVETQLDDEQVMGCCFMANDLLLGRRPLPTDSAIDKAASLLPFSNYLPDPDDPLDIPRNLILLDEIAPRLADRADYVDLAAEFERSTGLSPQTFCEFVFCLATKFITNLAAQNGPDGLVMTVEYFQHTRVRDGLIAFLGQYGITVEALQTEHSSHGTANDDFGIFRRHPVIEFAPGRYMCIDPGFLLDKAGRAFYWTLHEHTPANRQTHLLGYWAALIEHYVRWLSVETYRGRGQLVESPRFANNDEACDILMIEGSRLILIEIKASILSARAKYSFDPDVLRDEVLRKAIQGDHGKRKGIAQLRRTVERFQGGEPIAGIRNDQITTIYPIIVFLDKSFVSPYLPALYRDGFDRNTLRRRPLTTSPFVITVADLEGMLPCTHAHDVADILDDYYHCNRTASGEIAFGRLADAHIPLLRDVQRGRDLVRERFSRFNDDLISNIFPAEWAE
jgi:hypothetical protein